MVVVVNVAVVNVVVDGDVAVVNVAVWNCGGGPHHREPGERPEVARAMVQVGEEDRRRLRQAVSRCAEETEMGWGMGDGEWGRGIGEWWCAWGKLREAIRAVVVRKYPPKGVPVRCGVAGVGSDRLNGRP